MSSPPPCASSPGRHRLGRALVSDGYVVVSGGCDSSHALNGSVHAENVVVSRPSSNGLGRFCQAADPPNHGQDATVEASLVACRVASDPIPCGQMMPGSTFLAEINQRPAGDPIYYTNINTTNDVFTNPYTTGRMENCDRTNAYGELLTCNVTVQEHGPVNLVEHVGLASNGAVYSGIRQALTHRKVALNCLEL